MVATHTITSGDGATVEALVAGEEGRDGVLFLPAMGTPARFYLPWVELLAGLGLSVVVPEWRGGPTSDRRASRAVNHGYKELLELDIPAALLFARAHLKARRLFVGGHSLGGQLALLTLATTEGLEGAIGVACGTVHHRAWPGVSSVGLLAASQLAVAVAHLVGHFPGRSLRFAGREARGVMADWAHVARTGLYRVAGSEVDYEQALGRCSSPVLGVSLACDNLAPPSSMAELLGKLPPQRVTHLTLGEADGASDLDHFRWVKRAAPVAERVKGWVEGLGGVRPQG